MDRKLLNWIKKNEIEPILHKNHAVPATRREFLAQGLISYSSMVALPFLSRLAIANECGTSNSALIPFIVFDCAGGAALPANFLVGKQGGPDDYLDRYHLLGWDPKESGALDRQFGLPMSAKYSKILQGISQAASAEARKNFRMGSICHSAKVDTSGNPLSAIALVSRFGNQGSHIKRHTGNISSLSGGNSQLANAGNLNPALYVRSVSDLKSAVGFEADSPLGSVPKSRLKSLLSLGRELSKTQIENYLHLESGKALSRLSHCAYEENSNSLTSGDLGLDARDDERFQKIYGINKATVETNQAVVFGSLVRSVLTGKTGPTTLTIGGCDYHNNTQETGDAKDLEIGTYIGRAVEAAHQLKKPLFFQIITDGGCRNRPGTRVWVSDALETCMTVIGFYRPEGPPIQRRLQVGYYDNGQGAVPSALSGLGENPFKATCAAFANYLYLNVPKEKFEEEVRRYVPVGAFKDFDELESALVFS